MPGLVPAGKQSQALVEHIDFFPTFCELAGVPVPDYAQGKSLVPVISGKSDLHKDRVYSEAFYWGDEGGKIAMMFDGRYKVIDNGEKLPCELYDLKMDPKELSNVSQHPKYVELAEKRLAELRVWRTKEPGPNVKVADKTTAWQGKVLEPLDPSVSAYLIDASEISKNNLKGKPGKWVRALTVPEGSFERNSTYELSMDWKSKGLEDGAEFFATFAAGKDNKKNKQTETWTGESGILEMTLETTASDAWSVAVGVKGKGHLVVKRIRIRKK